MRFAAEFQTVLEKLRERLRQPGAERARPARQRITLGEVEAALRRIETGSYGTCAACFLVIPQWDLLDKPYREVCSRCAARRVRLAVRANRQLKAA